MQNLLTLVPLVDETRNLIKVYDTATWAYINVKLLHLAFPFYYFMITSFLFYRLIHFPFLQPKFILYYVFKAFFHSTGYILSPSILSDQPINSLVSLFLSSTLKVVIMIPLLASSHTKAKLKKNIVLPKETQSGECRGFDKQFLCGHDYKCNMTM